MSTLASVILKGLYSALPTAGIPGRLYFATDTGQTLRDNGTTWDSVSSSGITAVTGTAPIVSSGGSAPAISVTAATSSAPGVVQVDGTTIVASAGVISAVSAPPTGTAGGDLNGTFPNPGVAKVNGAAVPTTAAVLGSNGSGQLIANTGVATQAAVQQEAYTYAADTGSANAYAVTLSPAPTLVAGSTVCFKAANTNTGASTLAVNGGSAKTITANGNATALVAGNITAGQIIDVTYDGTVWQMVVPGTGGGGSVTAVTGTAPIISSGGTAPAISVSTATTSNLGVVKPDGSTITISSGVISASGSGAVTNITGSLTVTGATVSGGKATTTGSVSSITFASIPGTYNQLRIVCNGSASAATALLAQFNGDTGANYAVQSMRCFANNAPSTVQAVSQTGVEVGYMGALSSACVIDIPFYSATGTKCVTSSGGVIASVSSNTNNYTRQGTGVWSGTAAITQITIVTPSGTISSGSSFSIYGVS